MGPLRGDGNSPLTPCLVCLSLCREDGSPSWGRKRNLIVFNCVQQCVEKMGPLRGDGNKLLVDSTVFSIVVEKMGPLRGDGNDIYLHHL